MLGRRRKREPEKLPGGWNPGQLREGLLYQADPAPPQMHDQTQIARGMCEFAGPLIMGGGPVGSPPLAFKATKESIWTLNKDGTLYERVDWSGIGGFTIDTVTHPGKSVWCLRSRGRAFAGEFFLLNVVPAASMQQAFIDRAEAEGLKIELRKA